MSLRASFATRAAPCVLRWSDDPADGVECRRVQLLGPEGYWWVAWYWGRNRDAKEGPEILYIFYGEERQVRLRLRRIFRQSVHAMGLARAVIGEANQTTAPCRFCSGEGHYDVLWGTDESVLQTCKACWGLGDIETTQAELEFDRNEVAFMRELDEELGLV